MRIKIKFSDSYKYEQVNLFETHDGIITKDEGWKEVFVRIKKIGYKAGPRELISIQKQEDGYIYVEIDDNVEVVNV